MVLFQSFDLCLAFYPTHLVSHVLCLAFHQIWHFTWHSIWQVYLTYILTFYLAYTLTLSCVLPKLFWLSNWRYLTTSLTFSDFHLETFCNNFSAILRLLAEDFFPGHRASLVKCNQLLLHPDSRFAYHDAVYVSVHFHEKIGQLGMVFMFLVPIRHCQGDAPAIFTSWLVPPVNDTQNCTWTNKSHWIPIWRFP